MKNVNKKIKNKKDKPLPKLKNTQRRQKLPSKYSAGFLRQFDQRTETYALLTKAFVEVLEDMGGIEKLSHVQICMAERFVFLEFVIRSIEIRIAENPEKSDQLISRWVVRVNSLSGLGKKIGLERRAKKISSLESYVGTKKKKKKRKG